MSDGFIAAQSRVQAREYILVDAQILLQKALNDVVGNPRLLEDQDQHQEACRLWKQQWVTLAERLSVDWRLVKRVMTNEDCLNIKDLADALYVLGYELKLSTEKRSHPQ